MAFVLQRLSRGALLAGVLTISLVVGLIVFTAFGLGGGSGAPKSPPYTEVAGHAAAPHALPPGRRGRSESIGQRESGGAGDPDAPVLNEAIPFKPSAFRGPIADYRRYAQGQIAKLIPETTTLRRAIDAGDRGAARTAWTAAFARYQRLGAVYGAFGAIDQVVDGLPGGLPHGTADPHFTGLHRLEYGLWGPEPVRSLAPVAARLSRDVRRLRGTAAHSEMTPLDYATRAHEIIEDAQRDFLSGRHVPWSGEGVAATAAAVDATQAVFDTLHPLLKGQQSEVTSQAGLDRMRTTLRTIRRAHHGTDPTLAQLRPSERRALDASTSWALESLQYVPASLETVDPAPIPKLTK